MRQTELGLLPADWRVARLKDISHPVRGGSPRPAGDPRYFNGSFIPWLTVAALTNISPEQMVVSSTASFLTEEGALHSRVLEAGTLIIANSGATLGVAKILGIRCCANDGIAALLNLSEEFSPQFLTHYINSKIIFLREVVARGNGQPNLNTTLIGNFCVPMPPRHEQDAIAESLSDVDALIESLESLIAKKRALKQGAMQELLSGRRRLPGFTGEWQSVSLGEYGTTYGGLTGKSKEDFGQGDGQFVTFMNVILNVRIDCESFEHVRVSPGETQNRVRKGDLLFNGSSETPEEVALCSVIEDEIPDLFLNSFCFGFRFFPDVKASGLFLALYLRSGEGREIIKSLAQGSTRYNLSKFSLMKAAMKVPELREQIAITNIFRDFDAELDMLEQRLSKARQIKQGMMQELLTGRVRLL